MLARMQSKRNAYLLLVGMRNGTAALEGSMAVSYKTTWSDHMTQQLNWQPTSTQKPLH